LRGSQATKSGIRRVLAQGAFGILIRRKNGTTVAGQAFDFAQDFQNRRGQRVLVQAAGFAGGQAPETSGFCFASKRKTIRYCLPPIGET
jgi:hypothetical protein